MTFTADTVRLIRVDFGSSSGWSTPRGPTPRGALIEDQDIPGDIGQDDDVLLLNPGLLKTRAEARRLEHKVAKVAAKKCSVEEVTTLHKELQEWLTSDVKSEEQVSVPWLLSFLQFDSLFVGVIPPSECCAFACHLG